MNAGLILAAGEGVRFGSEPKLLAELEGRPVLEHAIQAQCAVPELERVVVVLGAHPAVIRGFGRMSAWRTTGRFRKTSVDDMAESFVLELERALGKR